MPDIAVQLSANLMRNTGAGKITAEAKDRAWRRLGVRALDFAVCSSLASI